MAWLRGFAAIYMTSLLLSNGCGKGAQVASPPTFCFLSLFLSSLSVLGIKKKKKKV
jgi:hypothetical protein